MLHPFTMCQDYVVTFIDGVCSERVTALLMDAAELFDQYSTTAMRYEFELSLHCTICLCSCLC